VKRKQRRFVRDVNHCVSKKLVVKAATAGKALALEDLSGIRERANGFNREMRWLLGNWAFDQLRRFVAYKAEAAGVPVYAVDPRNTSRTCHACGHYDPANRKSQARFLCLSCGLDAGADHNAALNIRARAAQSTGLLPRSSLSLTSGSLAPAASPQALAGGR
jgi:IS605 OrfB family transposase